MSLRENPCRRCEPRECSYNLRRRMSLTDDLKTPGGCAHYYLGKILPNLPAYVKFLNLPVGQPLTDAPKGWEAFIGTAFDHYLRQEYAPAKPDEIVLGGLWKLLCRIGWEDNLEKLTGGTPEERADLTYWLEQEGWLMERDVFKGLESESPEERALWSAIAVREFRTHSGEVEYHSLTGGGSSLKQALMDDLRRLMEIARDNLALKRPEFGPTFGISSSWFNGADADIVDEGCLIDIKCSRKPERTAFMRQAIAYALLDVDDEHQLDSVGIYLARQGIIWKVPLDDIAKQAGATLQELRENAPWGSPADREALRREISES